jgi:hypothetical protein
MEWLKLNSVALVRERTIPTQRPPLVGEVSTNFCGGCHMVSVTDPYGRNLDFLDRSLYFFFQVALQPYSRGWVDPASNSLLLRKSGSAGNWTRTCSQDLWPQGHRGGPWNDFVYKIFDRCFYSASITTCKRKHMLKDDNVFGSLRSTTFVHEVPRLRLLNHLFPELPNIYLSWDVESVMELYGQRFYKSALLSRERSSGRLVCLLREFDVAVSTTLRK